MNTNQNQIPKTETAKQDSTIKSCHKQLANLQDIMDHWNKGYQIDIILRQRGRYKRGKQIINTNHPKTGDTPLEYPISVHHQKSSNVRIALLQSIIAAITLLYNHAIAKAERYKAALEKQHLETEIGEEKLTAQQIGTLFNNIETTSNQEPPKKQESWASEGY